jgi:hypothetical protein
MQNFQLNNFPASTAKLDSEKAAISYFLTKSSEDFKTGVSIMLGGNRFSVYKKNPSDDEKVILAKAERDFLRLCSKLDPIPSDFFEEGGFREWIHAIGFELPTDDMCTEMHSLLGHFLRKKAADAAEDELDAGSSITPSGLAAGSSIPREAEPPAEPPREPEALAAGDDLDAEEPCKGTGTICELVKELVGLIPEPEEANADKIMQEADAPEEANADKIMQEADAPEEANADKIMQEADAPENAELTPAGEEVVEPNPTVAALRALGKAYEKPAGSSIPREALPPVAAPEEAAGSSSGTGGPLGRSASSPSGVTEGADPREAPPPVAASEEDADDEVMQDAGASSKRKRAYSDSGGSDGSGGSGGSDGSGLDSGLDSDSDSDAKKHAKKRAKKIAKRAKKRAKKIAKRAKRAKHAKKAAPLVQAAEDIAADARRELLMKQVAELDRQKSLRNQAKLNASAKPEFDKLISKLANSRNFQRLSGPWNRELKGLPPTPEADALRGSIRKTIKRVQKLELELRKIRADTSVELSTFVNEYFACSPTVVSTRVAL